MDGADELLGRRGALVCHRCQLQLEVRGSGRSLIFSYDVKHWCGRCCCSHLESPTACCSFFELERMIVALRRPTPSHGAN
jgi:hypothetical protein